MSDYPTILIIGDCGADKVRAKQNEIDPYMKHFLVLASSCRSVMSRRFSRILITREAKLEMSDPFFSSELHVETAQAWLRESLICRLMPGGSVVYI